MNQASTAGDTLVDDALEQVLIHEPLLAPNGLARTKGAGRVAMICRLDPHDGGKASSSEIKETANRPAGQVEYQHDIPPTSPAKSAGLEFSLAGNECADSAEYRFGSDGIWTGNCTNQTPLGEC
jgi:hypothetical protein